MQAILPLLALVIGLCMFLLSSSTKVSRVGEMLLFSSILSLLIALAPSAVRLLRG